MKKTKTAIVDFEKESNKDIILDKVLNIAKSDDLYYVELKMNGEIKDLKGKDLTKLILENLPRIQKTHLTLRIEKAGRVVERFIPLRIAKMSFRNELTTSLFVKRLAL